MPSQGIHGLEAQRKRLRAWAKNVDTLTASEVQDLANRIAENARNRAPVKTGRLQHGIRVGVTRRKTLIASTHAFNPKTNFDYALLQHNNTHYKHPKGEALYLTKAVREEFDIFEKRIRRRMRQL